MTDKQINKWLRRRFSVVGWVLVGYYLLMNLMVLLEVLLGDLVWMLQLYGGNAGAYGAAETAWGYIMAITIGLILLHAWKGSDFWREEVLARKGRMKPGAFLCLLILGMGAQMVNSFWITGLETLLNLFGLSAIGILESVSGSSDTLSMFLYASILAPVGEELLFRGYVLRSLKPFGTRFAVWGSAILFGLFHGNLLQTPYAVLMGLLLGYVTVEYSIGWSIMIHLFNNLVLADLLTRLTASWSDMAYGMLNMLLFGGSFLVAVGILVRNRKNIRDYRNHEWIDKWVVKWFFLNSGVIILSVIALVNMVSLLFI